MIKHINKTNQKNNDYLLLGQCEECLELLRALSDKTQQEIIMIFASQKELCVNDIVEKFKLSRPTISHHLNLWT